jgi:integrase
VTGKRRGHGEGSVYQLPDGRWRGAVDLGWLNGRRRRKYVTRRTRTEVAKALRDFTALADSGRLSTSELRLSLNGWRYT